MFYRTNGEMGLSHENDFLLLQTQTTCLFFIFLSNISPFDILNNLQLYTINFFLHQGILLFWREKQHYMTSTINLSWWSFGRAPAEALLRCPHNIVLCIFSLFFLLFCSCFCSLHYLDLETCFYNNFIKIKEDTSRLWLSLAINWLYYRGVNETRYS